MEGKLTISWKSALISPVPLYYELSIGSQQLGSSSIRKLITTENTMIEINDPDLTKSSIYFLSIRAINYAGLATQSNYMIDKNDVVILL